ncbi:MAG: F0F1 ATP synthase subunit B, partial [Bacteroidales bacterium]|nr:F0F1 ATP synthase subunit B [Bacteroidales bacterium]
GWPVITGMVERRKERIDKALAEAAEARLLLATLKQQGDELLKEAQEEHTKMMVQTSELRTQIIMEAREAATAEGRMILEQARCRIAEEKDAAMQELRVYVATLAVDVAEKILRQQLDSGAKQTDLINRLIDETVKPRA